MTLRDLATRAQTSHSTLAAYEAGRTSPTASTWWRVVRAAGADVEPVLTWRAPPDERRGDQLAALLALADELPTRTAPTIQVPPFGAPRGSSR